VAILEREGQLIKAGAIQRCGATLKAGAILIINKLKNISRF
jgi:hypothetical protein